MEPPSAAIAYCADQVRTHDSDRYATVLFAPAASRAALFALYAFNVEIAKTREVVSQLLVGSMRLQWWRDTLDGLFAGEPRRHEVALALAAAVRRHGLDRALLERLVDAREADLDDAPPATVAALTDYLDGTAASLAMLALQTLDIRDGAAVEAARQVGLAWGLTGLLRAIPFHARAGRLYLPEDVLLAAGVSAREPLALRSDPGLSRAVESLAGIAAGHLAAARRLRSEVPRGAVPALLPATLADGCLKLLRRAGYDPFDPRVGASLPSRSWRLLAATVTGRY